MIVFHVALCLLVEQTPPLPAPKAAHKADGGFTGGPVSWEGADGNKPR